MNNKFGKTFFLLLGIIIGIVFSADKKIPGMTEYLYLFMGILGGYFIFNFVPYFYAPEEITPATGNFGSTSPEQTPQEITVKKIFKASVFGDPITPDEVIFDKKGVTFNVKQLFGNTETFVLYSDVSGVEIVEGILLSTIKIKPKTRNTDIKIDNFAKADAKIIKKLILEKL